ncbi:MAG: glutamyl-tRNA reductase [Planctomycetota bacterium]
MRLLLIGCSHKSASLDTRERFAFRDEETPEALRELLLGRGMREAVILSTCNRVEVYAVAEAEGRAEELRAFLTERGGIASEDFESLCYAAEGEEVPRHLFAVASSLDSMVVGETQILEQVKRAYEVSRNSRPCGTGKVLHALFQRAFSVAKRVRRSTSISRRPVSVGSVAVEFAQRIFGDLSESRVLCVGTGEAGRQILTHLAGAGAARITVASRSPVRAEATAREFGGEAAAIEALPDLLRECDVVMTSTSSAEPILGVEAVKRALAARRGRPIFLLDVAIPRNVEEKAGEIEGAYLYNIDDLKSLADRNLDARRTELSQALRIVEGEAARFAQWLATHHVDTVIADLQAEFHRIRSAEFERLSRRLEHLTPGELAQIEQATKRIVNRILHTPITTLRAAEPQRSQEETELLKHLFKLEQGREGNHEEERK